MDSSGGHRHRAGIDSSGGHRHRAGIDSLGTLSHSQASAVSEGWYTHIYIYTDYRSIRKKKLKNNFIRNYCSGSKLKLSSTTPPYSPLPPFPSRNLVPTLEV